MWRVCERLTRSEMRSIRRLERRDSPNNDNLLSRNKDSFWLVLVLVLQVIGSSDDDCCTAASSSSSVVCLSVVVFDCFSRVIDDLK